MARDVTDLIRLIRSDDATLYVDAVHEASQVIQELLTEMIDKLGTTNTPGPIAERLINIVSSFNVQLEEVFRVSSDLWQKSLAGVVLLKLGSHVGVDHLMAAVRNREPTAVLATIALSNADITEAAGPIEDLVQTWDLAADPYAAATLVACLRRFGPLSKNILNKLSAEDAP
jgi:hypothetical protein